MLQRHKIPTIFNIYMLDVICCALGCVILLWQVAHQEAEQQTADAKEAHAEAKKQSEAAISARVEYEKAQAGLLSASNDVTHLQAKLADWKKKHQTVTLALSAAEKERDDAKKLASARADELAKSQAALKKLDIDLIAAKKSNRDQATKIAALIASADAKAKEQAV